MLLGNRLNLPKFGFSAGDKTQALKGSWGSLLLGALFALAFCPTSGVFYFGMLMPMAAAETGGYLLPIVFALATGFVITSYSIHYTKLYDSERNRRICHVRRCARHLKEQQRQ